MGINDYISLYKDNNQKGFTLVELLIVMMLSGIVIASIYSAFQSQQNSYVAQDQISEMQQNIRVGLDVMTREIRMVGYDPDNTGNYNVLAATSNSFNFTADMNEDGGLPGAGETFLYELYDTDGDGVDDALRRTSGGSAVAQNIEALEFVYLDTDNNVTTVGDKIRSVVISILARAAHPDQKYFNSEAYMSYSGALWGPYNDKFRRRLLIQTVNCRNMGLGS